MACSKQFSGLLNNTWQRILYAFVIRESPKRKPTDMIQDVKFDCKHFRGHIPCKPNKEANKICSSCDVYAPISKRILIIKLGAIGDVIRTTPLAHRYRNMYPNCHITWVTHSPDVLPKEGIDEIWKWDATSVFKARHLEFDIALNLDKEPEACILLEKVSATEKYGFIWRDNHLSAATPAAEHKLITGLYDNISQQNTKHYLDEIFEICHLDFQDEPYEIRLNKDLAEKWASLRNLADGKTIVGLNTGCGARWQTRLWPKEKWIELIQQLQNQGYFPLLLGGRDEHETNTFFSNETGAHYPGHFSLEEFIALTSNCDIIVTQVSMMMHIALALNIKMVLQNNIFNPHEFYLYNNGVQIRPSTGCDCYFGQSCSRERRCMHDLASNTIFEEIEKINAQ